jgi:hypothetical protein
MTLSIFHGVLELPKFAFSFRTHHPMDLIETVTVSLMDALLALIHLASLGKWLKKISHYMLLASNLPSVS